MPQHRSLQRFYLMIDAPSWKILFKTINDSAVYYYLNVMCCKLFYTFFNWRFLWNSFVTRAQLKLLVLILMMKWINNLYLVHLLTSASALSHLQNVPTHGSDFVWTCAHSPFKFVYINPNICVRSGVCNGYKWGLWSLLKIQWRSPLSCLDVPAACTQTSRLTSHCCQTYETLIATSSSILIRSWLVWTTVQCYCEKSYYLTRLHHPCWSTSCESSWQNQGRYMNIQKQPQSVNYG